MRADPWFWRIKAAHRDLIARCGGIARAAEIAGCSPAWAGKCHTPTEDAFLSAVQKRRLEEDAGEPIVTRAEAEMLGFAVLGPTDAAPLVACAHGAHAAVLAEAADVAGAFAERVRDGRFSGADAQALDRELAGLIDQAGAFRRVCAAISAAQAGAAPS